MNKDQNKPVPNNIREFEIMLGELYSEKTEIYKDKFNRSIPFSEMLIDRWEKARNLKFGEGTWIYDSALV